MSLPDLLDWLSRYWPLLGGLLTFLLVTLPSVWLRWQQDKRKAREERAKWHRLVSEADNLAGRAYKLLEFHVLHSDETAQQGDQETEQVEDPEQMLLEATTKYREAIPLSRSRQEKADLWLKVGRTYSELGRGWWAQAEEGFYEAIRCWKKHPKAWYNLAETQRGLLKDSEAVRSLRQHLQVSPADEDARWLLEQWTQPVPVSIAEEVVEELLG